MFSFTHQTEAGKESRRISPELYVPTIKRIDGVLWKECTACHKLKELNGSNFHIKKDSTFGFMSFCKQCQSDKDRAYRDSEVGRAKRIASRRGYFESGRATELGVKWARAKRMEVLQHYSHSETPSCACCGETTFEFLAIDHIRGGGRRALLECGETPSVLIKNGFPEGRRVLCQNCNCSMGHWGTCGHVEPVKDSAKRTMHSVVFGVNLVFDCGSSRADYERGRQRAMRRYAIAHYSNGTNQCACCGEDNFKFITIDHIHGGGEAHRRELAGVKMVVWLFKNKFPEGYRTLCYNCNMSLGIYGMCPHKDKHKLQVVTQVQGVCINAKS